MDRLQHPDRGTVLTRGASAPEAAPGGGTTPELPEGATDAGGAAAGLVICARTGRESVTTGQSVVDDLRGLEVDRLIFPTREDCREAAAAVGPWVWDGREGAVPQLEVAPGLVRITAPNLALREATANRNAERPSLDPGDQEDEGGTVGVVRGWSRKSRARMIARLAELDYSAMMSRVERPGMVTLTYPGNWEAVAPDGPTVKGHLQAFFKRYRRAWGESWSGIWKLEFQRRGAPHLHLFMTVPHGVAGEDRTDRQREAVGDGLAFRGWLSKVWADVVGAEGEDRARHEAAGTGVDFAEGDRARDPKRLAQYFSKHGLYAAKEYQHRVPELWEQSGKSVGRFWGYRGLTPVKAGATVTPEQSIRVARVLRGLGSRSTRWDAATRRVVPCPALRRVRRPRLRVDPDGTVHEQLRWQTVRVSRMTGAQFGAGYLCVNDGPAVARQLARYLEQREAPPRPAVGLRGPITDRLQPPTEYAAEDRRRFDDGRGRARLRLLGGTPVLPLAGS